ncbi:hypothetical protein [Mesorhizobium sp. L103C131B0]|uniref:hypothetical protein n=1 Tax=Mesorhizobium sp. L103C131B0 TaxID=1287089 RepID=UPI0003D0165F|nr:hypothetical protein [Mesorhizobium sp. L103C131B0]ESZ63211.1 hypothetical protein X729_07565 [Mesorhizobium sp. L103C131B0]
MTVQPRSKLTLGPVREGLVEESEDGPLQLATIDLTLPCRRFVVEHKVADVGKVSVTAEFLIRFVRAMGSCTEEAVQSFFGYSRREMAYVFHEVEDADYIRRSEGRITLTQTGLSLFRPGVEEPLIYEVERKIARVGFDLISLAPAEKKFLSYFERNLPELPLADVEQVSSATERVPSSFRRFFREFALKIDPISTPRRTLYSIDGVAAEERFSTLVRVRLMSSGLKPTLPDIDLSEWKSDYELSDREAVGLAVAEMLERMAVARREDDGEAYQLLIQLAQDYLKEWTRRDGLSVQRFYRHAFTSHGDVRADRPTVPIIGSLFTKENARRLFDVASYGLRKTRHAAAAIYWVVPQAPLWGSTSIMAEIVEQFREQINRLNEDLSVRQNVETISLTAQRPERWVKEAFTRGYESNARVFPGGFEMLLVPGAFVAATVHAPIGQQSGLPVPLGFASFDSHVLARAGELLDANAEAFKLGDVLRRNLIAPPATDKTEDSAGGAVPASK